MIQSIGTIQSVNAGLVALFLDRSMIRFWQESHPSEIEGEEFTRGHPLQILEWPEEKKWERLVVGSTNALAIALQGQTGSIDMFKLDNDLVFLMEPPAEMWTNHSQQIKALLDSFSQGVPAEAEDLGTLDLPAQELVVFNMWQLTSGDVLNNLPKVLPGKLIQFGNDGSVGAVLGFSKNKLRIYRTELIPSWTNGIKIAVVFLRASDD